MGTPLVIDDVVRARIAQVKAWAESHRFDFANMTERMKHPRHFEDINERIVEIPFGFRAVYSIEQQPPPTDWCHHLSFSSEAPGRVMDPRAVILLVGELGLEFPGWDKCPVYFEEESPRKPMNIMIPFTTQRMQSHSE